jgi:hypothetical protein
MKKPFIRLRLVACPSALPHNVWLTLLLFSISCWSFAIPADRLIPWSPGINVSIPAKPDTVNVTVYGARGDSSADDYSAFRAAIDALPASGGVVKIPAGKFRISKSLSINRGVVFFGAGATQTKLYFEMADAAPCIEIITYQRGVWTNITSGYTRGSRQVQVADASTFHPGNFAEIQQTNDSSVMYTDTLWKQSWADNSMGQMFVIEAVSGNTLTLNRPLYLDYRADLKPQMRTQGFVTFAGVENLLIARTVSTADGATISFKNAAYCWVKSVESDHTRKAHITGESIYACVFRDSYLHHAYDYGGDGHGYGVTLGLHVSDCLIENNIFRHLRHSMMVQVGASGNVFGYNYSLENMQGTGETDLNQGWTPCDISMHGHYPNNNLFEGNVVQEIDIADYWGPCGRGNTVFRNKVMAEGIDILDYSNDQNIAANVLPTQNYGIKVEAGITGTLSHGNVQSGAVQWDQSIADHTFPPSYYLTSKPVFFGSLEWPVFGPDVTGLYTLPAQKRYEDSLSMATSHSARLRLPAAGKRSGLYALYNIRGQRIGTITAAEMRKWSTALIKTKPGFYFAVDGRGGSSRIVLKIVAMK